MTASSFAATVTTCGVIQFTAVKVRVDGVAPACPPIASTSIVTLPDCDTVPVLDALAPTVSDAVGVPLTLALGVED